MARIRTLALAGALALVAGCGEPAGPGGDADIRGKVIDAVGEPVPDATVVLQLATDPPLGAAAQKPGTAIQFSLPGATEVTAWIASFCDDDTLRLLARGVLPAGQHTLLWDGRDGAGRVLPDGVYRAHVVTEAAHLEQALPLFHLGYAAFAPGAAPAAAAVTDLRGRFRLGQACLPFGFAFEARDETGQVIGTRVVTREVRVWAFSAERGLVAAGGWLAVDETAGLETTLRLIP